MVICSLDESCCRWYEQFPKSPDHKQGSAGVANPCDSLGDLGLWNLNSCPASAGGLGRVSYELSLFVSWKILP